MSTATVATANLAELAAMWRTARRLYPIFLAINRECNLGQAPCRELETPIDRSDPESVARVQDWLEKLDTLIQVHQLRQLLQTTQIVGEEGLRALLKRQLERPEKDSVVRDKVDYLLVQYYAHCAPHDVHATNIDHDHVAQVLAPVVGEVSPLVPDFCQQLDEILAELEHCASLGDLLQKKIIDRARTMKDQAGSDYFKPSVLVAYARFNFLLRRGFFRLMHADLHAIRLAIHSMEARGQHSCDCSSAGLSADQAFAELREICHEWKKPFRAAYSVGNTFSQLVSVRAAVEAALAKPVPTKTSAPAVPPAPQAQPKAAQPAPMSEALIMDTCIMHLHDELIKIASKSSSAGCNFTLAGTKLVFASWEVAAFVKPTSASAPGLRRAVAARVLLIQAMEARKKGDSADMSRAIAWAHEEIAHLQAEIASAKDRKEIDTAVSLSATSKRLLALVEQAEKGK